MSEILIPVAVFAVLGILMGLILALSSRLLAVKKDERIEQVEACLPGANCGGCGYAGCSALAEAIVRGDAKVNACVAGGADATAQIGAIMGQSVQASVRMTAKIMCSGTTACSKRRFTYSDIRDCHSAEVLGGGDKFCAAGCIGLGSCAAKCAFGAISVTDGVAVVDREKCRGCGMCVSECPKHIIHLIPYDSKYYVQCASPEKGKKVRLYCDAGCIGCRICEKNCPSGAIALTGGDIASIDYAKCTGCGICFEKCPRKIIRMQISDTPAEPDAPAE
ncbi:MAG: RnfABCDGE type electron transport complex subunit B [Eubacteriales bacterium]